MKTIYALLLGLFLITPAQAQNITCPTRPAGDSTNACASTAFVGSAGSTALPLASTSQIYIGSGVAGVAGITNTGTGVLAALAIAPNTTGGFITSPAGNSAPFVNAVSTCGVVQGGSVDQSTAINTCLSTYNAVALPCGTYYTTATITVASNQSLIGGGRGCTVISKNSTTAVGITISAVNANIVIRDLTVLGVGTPTSSAHGLIAGNGVNYINISNCLFQNNWIGALLGSTATSWYQNNITQNNYNAGVFLTNSLAYPAMQWEILNNLSQFNDGWGFQVTPPGSVTSVLGGNWTGNETYANTQGGVALIGATSSPLNDIFFYGNILSSDGGVNSGGLFIQAFGGANIQINHNYIELVGQVATGHAGTTAATHTGYGILFPASTGGVIDALIEGNKLSNNSYGGLGFLDAVGALSVVGNNIQGNGLAAAGTWPALSIQGTPGDLLIASNIIGSHGGTTSNYGIGISIAATNYAVNSNVVSGFATAGCLLTGSPIHVGNVGTGC